MVREKEVGEKVTGHVVVSNKALVPKYFATVNDLSWVTKGMVVSVLNGDAIPVLQWRVLDAGFDNLAIIPLGANKVLLHTIDDSEVSTLLSEAA